MRLDRFILSYLGNKYIETKKYLSDDLKQYADYDIICEPCCGIFGFSRAFVELVPEFKGEIWLNDINTELINSLNEIKYNPLEVINSIRTESEKYYCDSELSYSKTKSFLLSRTACGVSARLCSLKKANSKLNNYSDKIDEYKIFFDKVKFFNLPYNDFIEKLPLNKKILIFIDPPYFNSYNLDYQKITSSINKKNEAPDGTSLYIDIYKTFKNDNKFNIIMIINKIEFINYFFEKWNYKDYKGIYQTNKNVKHHIIYKK